MQKILLTTLFGLGIMLRPSYTDFSTSVDLKAGYSKLNHMYKHNSADSLIEAIKTDTGGHSEKFKGHRMFGIGATLRYNFPKYFFIGIGANFKNTNSKYDITTSDNTCSIKFSSKNSFDLMPIVGISIGIFDIYGGAGIGYNRINYEQYTADNDKTSKDYNDYKTHKWKGNFTWCAGIDANINSKASLGIEYKNSRIRLSFTELPNDDEPFKSHFKTNNHIISATFKYKF